MIRVTNTENLTGVNISGAFENIYGLYEAISNVLGPEVKEDLVSFRILGFCYEIRHCYMGDREVAVVDNNYSKDLQKFHGLIHNDSNLIYSINILWIELMFVVLALDDFLRLYDSDKEFNKMFKNAGYTREEKSIASRTRFEDIAIVRLFQEKVWMTFMEASGELAYKRLYKKRREYVNNRFASLRYMDYCTHYVDELEMKYLKSDPKKREKLLATLINKLIKKGQDYYELEDMIRQYALEENISIENVAFKNHVYPEIIIW